MRSIKPVSTRRNALKELKGGLGVPQDMGGQGSGGWNKQGGEIRGQGLFRKVTRAREESSTKKGSRGMMGTKGDRKVGKDSDCY